MCLGSVSRFRTENGPTFIYRLLDLLNCFELLCGVGGYDMSSICAHPGLFDRSLLPPALSDMGTLVVAGVRSDVCGAALLWGGDLVRASSRLMMSYDTGDGDGRCFPMAMAARSRTGGSGCCGWLQFVTRGARPVAPPINIRERTVVLNRRGGDWLGGVCQDCVHSAGII